MTGKVRKALTDKTWADYPMLSPNSAGRATAWEVLTDLGYQLSEMTLMSVEEARLLVSCTATGLPLVLTWDTELWDLGTIERTETTVLVRRLMPPSLNPERQKALPGMVDVRYSGVSHSIYLPWIVSVRPVAKSVTYRDLPTE